jgi:peptidoglycan/xylan/chitin deacetylase (PgdA/CDA1 family)
MKKYIKEITPAAMAAEVTSVMATMFEEQKNLTTEFTYGRMTAKEFAADRAGRNAAGLLNWFDDGRGNMFQCAARILKKQGFTATAAGVGFQMPQDQKDELKNAYDSAISAYLAIATA